jgi:hypothetical protein
MGTQSGPANRQKSVSAAVRRFPQHELAAHQLADRDESFRDMCEELAEAELALARVDEAPAALRAARKAEWQEIVGRLAKEIEAVLQERTAFAKSRSKPWMPR